MTSTPKRQLTATVVADSRSPDGDRITTLELTFPRFILAELNTHRAFSRNSASSRARSVKKTIQEVSEDPFVPWHWPSERVGMAGGVSLAPIAAENAARNWRFACEQAIDRAEELVAAGVHKSIVNRLLEPFMWHTAVVTATDWRNFFDQRLALLEDNTPAAEPHFFDLAAAMLSALKTSKPVEGGPHYWHTPYVDAEEIDLLAHGELTGETIRRLSVARCAGVSYLNQGRRDRMRDLALYDRLYEAEPPHWSPFEHVATPVVTRGMVRPRRYNLTGWVSLRWLLESGITGEGDL